MTLPRRTWIRLNRLHNDVGRFRFCLYKWVWPPLQPVSVAQNKYLAILPSNVQSIDLSMDSMAWRFWTMRQSNGYSTPAPRSSAAKQWFEQLAQKKKNILLSWCKISEYVTWTGTRLFGLADSVRSRLLRFRSSFFGHGIFRSGCFGCGEGCGDISVAKFLYINNCLYLFI